MSCIQSEGTIVVHQRKLPTYSFYFNSNIQHGWGKVVTGKDVYDTSTKKDHFVAK